MKIFVLLLLLCMMVCTTNAQQQSVEQIGLECIVASYQKKGVDIKAVLEELEDCLVKAGSLKDRTGESYIAFHEKALQVDSIPAHIPENLVLNISRVSYGFHMDSECRKQIASASNFEQSTFKKLIDLSKEPLPEHNITKAYGIERELSVMKPKDFENPFYKAMALISIVRASKEGKFE
ncbi:hypothetical protein [Aquimarina macrocephali]|uniref:hypothetical protein n=1 Tax=Aquimarina macrocephali TaxID=666563 RepID=UPI0004B59E14|nr:hypothetical protein [Aquimarina macrocephali]